MPSRPGFAAARARRIALVALVTLAASQAQAQAQPQTQPEAPPAPPAGYSAAALYNLGNAYARAGKPSLAVLNYQRARLLAPFDADLEANLRFVRESAKLPAAPPTWFERTFEFASPTVLYWSGSFGVLLAGACLLAGRLTARARGLRRVGIAVGVALAGLTVGNALALRPLLHTGVILTAATPARVSPVPMGDPLFTLPEADTVQMTDEHEGFVLIETRDGKTGWVAAANLAPVVPRH
jgi:hypothetical protein